MVTDTIGPTVLRNSTAWPLRKDDTHNSGKGLHIFFLLIPLREAVHVRDEGVVVSGRVTSRERRYVAATTTPPIRVIIIILSKIANQKPKNVHLAST